MTETEPPSGAMDWSLTTWEGARREQVRHWSELSLEQVLLALEEMEQLADWLSGPPDRAGARD